MEEETLFVVEMPTAADGSGRRRAGEGARCVGLMGDYRIMALGSTGSEGSSNECLASTFPEQEGKLVTVFTPRILMATYCKVTCRYRPERSMERSRVEHRQA
jgi:hypothetical protein